MASAAVNARVDAERPEAPSCRSSVQVNYVKVVLLGRRLRDPDAEQRAALRDHVPELFTLLGGEVPGVCDVYDFPIRE